MTAVAVPLTVLVFTALFRPVRPLHIQDAPEPGIYQEELTIDMAVDRGWHAFRFGPAGEIVRRHFRIPKAHPPEHLFATVTDAFCPGDMFELLMRAEDDGDLAGQLPIGKTSWVSEGVNCTRKSADPDVANQNALWSHGTFLVQSGMVLSLRVVQSPRNGGLGYLRVDRNVVQCTGPTPGHPYAIVSHPLAGHQVAPDLCRRAGKKLAVLGGQPDGTLLSTLAQCVEPGTMVWLAEDANSNVERTMCSALQFRPPGSPGREYSILSLDCRAHQLPVLCD